MIELINLCESTKDNALQFCFSHPRLVPVKIYLRLYPEIAVHDNFGE